VPSRQRLNGVQMLEAALNFIKFFKIGKHLLLFFYVQELFWSTT